jgi:predicted small lipoprotein YifL
MIGAMTKHRALPLLLVFLAALALEGCGRKDLPDYPPDADPRPANLPRRGTPVPYN